MTERKSDFTLPTESEKFEESGYSTEVSQEEEDPIVIGEDVDRRDSSNTKYFKMSDGTIKAAVYKDPVLYQDSAGKWQEIDNTLETSDNTEQLYLQQVSPEYDIPQRFQLLVCL